MDKALKILVCHSHDRDVVVGWLNRLPVRFRRRVAQHYTSRYTQGDMRARFDANTALRKLVAALPEKAYSLAADDTELCEYAKRWSEHCQRLAAPIGDREKAYRVLSDYAERRDIQPPDPIGSDVTYSGAVARLTDELWWRRAIRRDHGRCVEALARDLLFVHKHAGIYSSDETLYRRRGQKSRNRRMLEEICAINEVGQEYTLAELAELSVSNPVIRRGELMMRIAGFEAWADHVGDAGEFITLTCPSRMHKATTDKANGRTVENPKYDGTTPRDAQRYLSGLWARIRASLDRQGLKLYGFRVAEPHHDGCPHWHFLVFFPENARQTIRDTFLRYGLAVDGEEAGADKRRVTFKSIDKTKGTAAGYIAKYIAKNIDGHGIDTDLYGTESSEAAERVDAWAACWGIRQFQQLGGPPVTVWRELRRLHDEEGGILEDARAAADAGNWFEFLRIMGGATAPRKGQPIRPAYWHEIDKATGELPTNRYGELAATKLFGLQVDGVYRMTRWHQWEIRWARKPSTACGTAIQDIEYSPGNIATIAASDNPPPWSSVNNCTLGSTRNYEPTEEIRLI